MTSTPGATSRWVAMLVPESWRSSCSLRSATSSRFATKRVERGEITLQALDRGLDRGERVARDGAPPFRSAMSASQALDFGRDRLGDLLVLRARRRGQERRRRGHDPLGLTRQLERGQRRGTRSWVMRPSTLPTSANEYMPAAAAITANALMPKNASSRRQRTPRRCRSEPAPASEPLRAIRCVHADSLFREGAALVPLTYSLAPSAPAA